MEANLTAYARGHMITQVKNNVRTSAEYKQIQENLTAAKKRYAEIADGFEIQAAEIKQRERNPIELRMRFQELKRTASATLAPVESEIVELEKSLKELEGRMLVNLLLVEGEGEIKKIYDTLEQLGVKKIQRDKIAQWSRRWGAPLLILHFETDKSGFKEIERKLKATPFQNLEIFISC